MPGAVSVICGASGGLGPAVLTALAPLEGTRIGVASERSDPDALRGIDATVRWERCDLTDPGAVADLWNRIDGIGAVRRLINVTGGFTGGRFLDTAPEVVRAMLDVNLLAIWWSTHEAARRMADGAGGVIVNIGAQAAVTLGPGSAAYSVAKAGVLALTRVLAAELSSSGIRVNAIIPETIDTPANRAWMRPADIARAVSPADVARVIATLCDERSTGTVSGALLPVVRTAERRSG